MAAIAFGDCLRGSFHFDDYAMLADPQGPAWYLQTRPFTQLTFWMNFQASATEPLGYHLVNLLLHIAASCLLFQVLQLQVPKTAALLAAIVFAIHPLQSEAVSYVFARGALLSTLFCLLCWRFWIADRAGLALFCFACALLSKEDSLTFPIVLALFGPRRWKALLAMLALACIIGLHTVYATRVVQGSGAGFSAGVSPLSYLAAQGFVICRYLGRLAIPWGFTIDPDTAPPAWLMIVSWISIAAAIALFRKNRLVIAGFILLIPSSSIFPAADLAADRRMYLPMICFSAALALAVLQWRPLYLVLIALVLTTLSIQRMEVWKTEASLWREAVERSPRKARPRVQLARTQPSGEALITLASAPETVDVLSEKGRVYLQLGRPAEALREFGRALALAPQDAHAANNRGVALLALGQSRAAKRDFERALSLDPTLAEARANLARAIAAEK